MAAGTIVQKTPKFARSFARAAAPLAFSFMTASAMAAHPTTDTSACYAVAVVNADGQLIPELSRNADAPVMTASIAKLVTGIIIDNLIREGVIRADEQIKLRGKNTTVTIAINHMLIHSDNEAAEQLGKLASTRTSKPFSGLAADVTQSLRLEKTAILSPSGLNDVSTTSGIFTGPFQTARNLLSGLITPEKRGINITTPREVIRILHEALTRHRLRQAMETPEIDGRKNTNHLLAQGFLGKTGTANTTGGNAVIQRADGTTALAAMHCSRADRTTRWKVLDWAQAQFKKLTNIVTSVIPSAQAAPVTAPVASFPDRDFDTPDMPTPMSDPAVADTPPSPANNSNNTILPMVSLSSLAVDFSATSVSDWINPIAGSIPSLGNTPYPWSSQTELTLAP